LASDTSIKLSCEGTVPQDRELYISLRRESGADRLLLCEQMMRAVMVAMSGGIDSAVAAARLVRQGWPVTGVTMDLGLGQRAAPRRAAAVCRRLGIEHYVVDLSQQFREQVIDYFCAEYAAGRTPNPCVRCNQSIKWDALLEVATLAGCRYLATGHYARKTWRKGRYRLLRGADRNRDQSYVLYQLSQQQLSCALFPLGNSTGNEVQSLARMIGINPGAVPASQDICFISGDYRDFLRERIELLPGPICTADGEELGRHSGLPNYTVGQRRGLGLGGEPLYVIGKDVSGNVLIVGPQEALARRQCNLEQVNWVSLALPWIGAEVRVAVELRYRAEPIPATVRPTGPTTAHLTLAAHEQAVAPGQSAVFYRGDLLLGGGIIAE